MRAKSSSTFLLAGKAMLAIVCLFSSAETRAGILADSVAQFSSTQGQDGWFYGYSTGPFTGSNFTEMTQFTTSAILGPRGGWFVNDQTSFDQLIDVGGHPQGTITTGGHPPVEQWAVREWVSNFAGEVTISGLLAKIDGGGGNGINGDIFVDGKQVYSQFIGATDTAGAAYSFTESLHVGSVVAFAIDPIANDRFDATKFTGVISSAAVPEPSSVIMLGTAIVGLAGMYRRRMA